MIARQRFDKAVHPVEKILFALAVVMDVNVDVADAVRGHARQRIEKLGTVLFLRKEERVFGMTSGRIGVSARDFRPQAGPKRHTRARR